VKDGVRLKQVDYKPSDFEETKTLLSEIFDVISKGYYSEKD
jgi:hypothetical protein